MIIEWLGHACFKISYGKERVLLDPFDSILVPGYVWEKQEAERVLCSHCHSDHNFVEKVDLTGRPLTTFILKKMMTYHDECCGAKRGNNAIHILEAGGFRVAHLGDIGCEFTNEQIEFLKNVDVCMVPVGGTYTIDAAKARKMMNQITPRIIIPMHYRDGECGVQELDSVEHFTDLFDKKEVWYHQNNVLNLNKDKIFGVVVLNSNDIK